MERSREILYLQVRIARLAGRTWAVPIDKVARTFEAHHVPEFIAENYDLLHLEGDEAVLEDVERFMRHKTTACKE